MQARRGQAGSARPRKVAKNANVGVAHTSNSANSGWAVCTSAARRRARTRAAGAAVLCSARAPACRDCPGQRLEVAARAVTVTPLRHWYCREKTFGQPLSAVVPSPAPWRGQGLRGARRSRPGRTAQYYYRAPPHSAQLGFIAVALLLLESCVPHPASGVLSRRDSIATAAALSRAREIRGTCIVQIQMRPGCYRMCVQWFVKFS